MYMFLTVTIIQNLASYPNFVHERLSAYFSETAEDFLLPCFLNARMYIFPDFPSLKILLFQKQSAIRTFVISGTTENIKCLSSALIQKKLYCKLISSSFLDNTLPIQKTEGLSLNYTMVKSPISGSRPSSSSSIESGSAFQSTSSSDEYCS